MSMIHPGEMKYWLSMIGVLLLLGLIMFDGCYFGQRGPQFVWDNRGKGWICYPSTYTREPIMMQLFTEPMNPCWGPE